MSVCINVRGDKSKQSATWHHSENVYNQTSGYPQGHIIHHWEDDNRKMKNLIPRNGAEHVHKTETNIM
eukprot:6795265-Karenia_brevis.AAC.1